MVLDGFGRQLRSEQHEDGSACIATIQSYDGLETQQYPSSLLVKTCYDDAGLIKDVSSTGTTTATFAYAPFGEEIPDTLGNRSSNACFAASFDGRHRFTGQERDEESDLDYFLARYYSGPMGRFLSVDPLLSSGRPDDPQTWNKYQYVGGNPLSFTDPLGLYRFAVNCSEGDSACDEQQQRSRDALVAVRAAADALKEGSKERKQLERALKRIGEEEGKGAWIAFGSDLMGGALAVANPATKTITFDLAKIDANAAQWMANSRADGIWPAFGQRHADAFLAGVLAHEGGHLPGRFGMLNPFSIGTERKALYTESVFYQGRGLTALAPRLWHESWRLVDRKKLEERRSAAIEGLLK